VQARVHALDDAGAVFRRWKQQQKQKNKASASEAPGSIAAQEEQRGGVARGGGERWRSTPHKQHSTDSQWPNQQPVAYLQHARSTANLQQAIFSV
jgi:hypothetical protein